MHELPQNLPTDKRELYQLLQAQLRSLLEGESDLIANTANMAALLYHSLPDLNWVGFYFLKTSSPRPLKEEPDGRAAKSSSPLPLGEGPGVRAANEVMEDQENVLVLGPFQGQVACVRIPLGKGVCGTAAKERKTLVIQNVHEFPGHIACDAASNSEIVLPLIKDQKVVAVLDLDSPNFARFDEIDRQGLEKLVETFVQTL